MSKTGEHGTESRDRRRSGLRPVILNGLHVLLTVKYLVLNYDRRNSTSEVGNSARRYFENKNLGKSSAI